MLRLKILSILLLATFISGATTWDEPWADQVIKQSSTFLLAKIIKSDPKRGVDVQVLNILSGKNVPVTFRITNYSLLDLCSRSGEGPEFEFEENDTCYFFISQNTKGEYCIATPTTGFSAMKDGVVAATFRHSYHQAAVPFAVFELTMTAIFNHYHSIPYDDKPVIEFVNRQLSKKPAGFNEEEIETFFLQHAALETTFHLNLDVSEEQIILFLEDSTSFHNQVSGARALASKKTASAKQALAHALSDGAKTNFMKVVCIWSLQKMNAVELKPQLTGMLQSASDEENDFGGDIMDHRICTSVPTFKEALQELIKTL